jgi:hypothetical protein
VSVPVAAGPSLYTILRISRKHQWAEDPKFQTQGSVTVLGHEAEFLFSPLSAYEPAVRSPATREAATRSSELCAVANGESSPDGYKKIVGEDIHVEYHPGSRRCRVGSVRSEGATSISQSRATSRGKPSNAIHNTKERPLLPDPPEISETE